MKTLTWVKVGKYPDTGRIVARVIKALFDDEKGHVISKYVLSTNGEWLELEIGFMYPDNTEFEVEIQEIYVEPVGKKE